LYNANDELKPDDEAHQGQGRATTSRDDLIALFLERSFTPMSLETLNYRCLILLFAFREAAAAF
jgi:hypothetical protein